jgi:hypothetical protein
MDTARAFNLLSYKLRITLHACIPPSTNHNFFQKLEINILFIYMSSFKFLILFLSEE